MKESTAALLTNFFDEGYLIQIKVGPYVNGNVIAMGKLDYDDDDSPYVYTDETYSDSPLSEIDISQVFVMQPINIFEVEPEYQEEFDMEEPEDAKYEEENEDEADEKFLEENPDLKPKGFDGYEPKNGW